MRPVLLDTHVLLWWKAPGRSRLSPRAAQAIEDAGTILVSPVTCWEVATLVRLGRIELDRDPRRWVRDLLGEPGTELAPLSAVAAADAGGLEDFHGDPADRLIYATARELRVPLVTKDRKLRDRSRGVTTLW
ncbi:MAG TPA: type II toxin-antitoxin system VapC family toxin [Nitriliruptorales bacterium]